MRSRPHSLPASIDKRPSPEELLRRVQAEERRERRGRLKVFLGYASRVGKSFRMLDEGRRRKERGEDVVVAAIQFPAYSRPGSLDGYPRVYPGTQGNIRRKRVRSAQRRRDFPPPSARLPGGRIGLR